MSSADITDGALLAEIEHIVVSVKNSTLPDIKALYKRKLKMNMGESDVDARILDYFKTFNKVTLDNGLSECFTQADGAREKCKRLVSALLPAALKKEVKQCVRFTHKDAAADTKKLFDLIVEKAKEHERQFQRLKQQKKEASGRSQPESKPQASPKPKQRWNNKPAVPAATPVYSTGTAKVKPARAAAPKPPSRPKSTNPPPGPCPKCSEMHWLNECTKATEAEKVELIKQLREARKTKKARLKRLGELLPSADRQVTLNGVLTLPYCPDSGSDYTVIGRSHWEMLREADPSVEMEKLAVPIQNQAFGSTWVTANMKVKLHVLLHTAAGPVEPMGAVDVLVVDADDDEFIVGNDLLTALGIDVDRQLEQLAGRGDDETSGDGIELEADELPVNLDGEEPSDVDIFAAVERLIARAVEKGFPSERVEELRGIAHAYDVWRLELRADPPASASA